jgi:hypothetical protein
MKTSMAMCCRVGCGIRCDQILSARACPRPHWREATISGCQRGNATPVNLDGRARVVESDQVEGDAITRSGQAHLSTCQVADGERDAMVIDEFSLSVGIGGAVEGIVRTPSDCL